MRKLLILSLLSIQAGVFCGVHGEPIAPSVQLAMSDFRQIREVSFQGRDLSELAIRAGMGNESFSGAERGEVSVRGRTWHGSNGIGLVAYDPQGKRYTIYYRQETIAPGHHLEIFYADEDYIFFGYGYHKELPKARPGLEVYSVKRDGFARIEAVTTRGGKFGHFDIDLMEAPKPEHKWPLHPARTWDDRHYREKEWVPITEGLFFYPRRISRTNSIFILRYHTGWGIEATTTIQFAQEDLEHELDRIFSKSPQERNLTADSATSTDD